MPKSTPQGVIDTNILVRANINPKGTSGLVVEAFLNEKFELLYSEKLIKEINKTLRYKRIFKKYNFTEQIISDFVDSIVDIGKLVFSPEKVKLCRDSDDDELLSIALAIYTKKPIYVVSGDEDLLALKGKIDGVIILTAGKFLNVLK